MRRGVDSVAVATPMHLTKLENQILFSKSYVKYLNKVFIIKLVCNFNVALKIECQPIRFLCQKTYCQKIDFNY